MAFVYALQSIHLNNFLSHDVDLRHNADKKLVMMITYPAFQVSTLSFCGQHNVGLQQPRFIN